MHVTFVSQCERKALKRTRTLLDRYAIRVSGQSWMTPITKEALEEVHFCLRQSATRQTAVACYHNHGLREMRLLWVVGRGDVFGPRGELAVGTRRKPRKPPPLWAQTVALLAKASGLAHDLGKGSQHFQDKLVQGTEPETNQPIKDRIRHEWVSMKLYQTMRSAASFEWQSAWNAVRAGNGKHDLPFDGGKRALKNASDAVDFAVLTHHGLLGPKRVRDGGDFPTTSEHTEREGGEGDDATTFTAAGPLEQQVLHDLAKATERLMQKSSELPDDPLYWRAATLIARASLILADHEVSAINCLRGAASRKQVREEVFANTATHKQGRRKGQVDLNQKLGWHLSNVGRRAQEIVLNFATPELPGLPPQSRETILARSHDPKFQWQDMATAYLISLREQAKRPTLTFNLAGTGSGKTRMNVKALAALRNEEEPLRIAAGFNLRTLTLQTHHALKQELRIAEHEIACVIGDQFSRTMHEVLSNTDEDSEAPILYETYGMPDLLPEWLEQLAVRKPELRELVGTPILVSTMDYLVNAGEPGTQGHHGHALLRIASSDLILDEVDSYDPISLAAVLRVVQMSGLFWRHVVASSATLAQPVAEALFIAYMSGVSMRSALYKVSAQVRTCFLDNHQAAYSTLHSTAQEFEIAYADRLEQLVRSTQQQPAYRIAFIKEMQTPQEDSDALERLAFEELAGKIKSSVETLHKSHRWEYMESKWVSFGLVRVATVRTCVKIAKQLAKLPNTHVTAYHSVDLRLRRFHKERRLDLLLNRMDKLDGCFGNNALLEDPDIRTRVVNTPSKDVLFIVVATPIEEVGRDHDFDWGVIEPSSVQSIVQLAGRLNRHRLVPVEKPNLAILQYNLLALQQKNRVFTQPGNEVPEVQAYTSHDAKRLLGRDAGKIDACLRFGVDGQKCLFSIEDDRSINERLQRPLKVLQGIGENPLAWATQCHYREYPLRQSEAKRQFRVGLNDREDVILEEFDPQSGLWNAPAITLSKSSPANQYWLADSLDQILAEAAKMETQADKINATMFEARDIRRISFDHHLGGY